MTKESSPAYWSGCFVIDILETALRNQGFLADNLHRVNTVDHAGKIWMSHQNGNDSRRYKRWDIFEYALVYLENDPVPEPAIIVDLSLGGLQARCRKQYVAGGTCQISIVDDQNRTICTHAEIRYSYPLPGSDLFATGFKFAPGSVEQRVTLVNYIHQRFQEDIDTMAI